MLENTCTQAHTNTHTKTHTPLCVCVCARAYTRALHLNDLILFVALHVYREVEGELLNRLKELKGGMEECKKRNTAVYGNFFLPTRPLTNPI